MKKLVLIDGIKETVYMPVFQSIMLDLRKILQLNDVPIVNNDNVLLEKDMGTTIIDKNLHNTYIQATCVVEPVSELELYRVPVNPDTKCFYRDKEVGVKARASYRSAKMNFEIMVKSKSESTLGKVMDLLYHRKLDVDTFNMHNIQISYVIPNITKQLMIEVFNIKKSIDTTLTIEEYLAKVLDKNMIDMNLALSGNPIQNSLTVTEYQVDVVGEFLGEFDKLETEKDDLYYYTQINYSVTINRPLGIHLEYPILIYNQKLSDTFIMIPSEYIKRNVRNHEKSLIELLKRHDSFGINKNGYYLTYPKYDDFTIPHKLNNYTTIMTVLVQIEDGDDVLFNINELPTLKFKDSAYNLLIAEKEHISKYLNSIFYFNLYINDNEIKEGVITIDVDGTVRTNFPMSVKNSYRLGIHLCDNLTSMGYNDSARIMKYIDDEIIRNENLVRANDIFGIERKKTGIRINNDGIGVETYKEEELFLDIYLGFFDVEPSEVSGAFNRLTTQKASELLFKIRLADFSWTKLSATHHVVFNKLVE